MDRATPPDELEEQALAASTASTDTAVPDDQEPQVAGDSGILLGSEATTVARNQDLVDQGDARGTETSREGSIQSGRPGARRPGRRGPLRRR
jgi:hypothetical protein